MKTILLLVTDLGDVEDIQSVSARVCDENQPSFEQYITERAQIEGVECRDVGVLHTLNLEEWIGSNADRRAFLEKLALILNSSVEVHALNDLLSVVAGTAYVRGVQYGYDTW